jgi:preprotein translocase subunit SecB
MPKKRSSRPSAGETKPAATELPPKRDDTSSTKTEMVEEDLFRLAEPVAAAVEIHRVSLVECYSHLDSSMFFPEMAEGTFRANIRYPSVEVAKREEKNQFIVKAQFSLVSRNKEDPSSEPRIAIGAVFILVYSVKAIADFSDKELTAFAKTNGVFNAWPYWREFVQSTSTRMGIPPIIVPVFRL